MGTATTPGKYSRFWKDFEKPMKLGLIEDSSNRQRLAKLLRFISSKSNGQLTSLEDYVERMRPSQKKIYYIIGKASERSASQPRGSIFRAETSPEHLVLPAYKELIPDALHHQSGSRALTSSPASDQLQQLKKGRMFVCVLL